MTGQVIFFGALLILGIIAFILLVKNKKKKGPRPDTTANDPTEAILQKLDDL